jgi:arylsulfatase A-like enzyme
MTTAPTSPGLARAALCAAFCVAATAIAWTWTQTPARPPNFVLILTDDQGYGDLGSYGHPTLRTPNIDAIAAEGQRWTSFYAAPVCTPSRAQLVTGRLAVRTGLAGGVLFPDSTGGLQPEEITIAEVLKTRGYATAAVGKWHLGSLPQYLPTNQGFDSYFGIPYSNDMDATEAMPQAKRYVANRTAGIEAYNVPLLRGTEIVERPADQTTITRRYTDEGIAFIRKNRERPFFLYLAHNLPHVPLFRSQEFAGRSQRGVYGDVVEEIDANVGRIVATLRELGLERNTLVVFTSDNGPWAPFLEQGGSAGLLRGAKGSTWEGGVRVPAIFYWPGTIPRGVVSGLGSELDLLQTFASLAGATAPTDRVLDGYDLSRALLGKGDSPRALAYYYANVREGTLAAVRRGAYKAHFAIPGDEGGLKPDPTPAQLYNLDQDPSEKYDLAAARPEIIDELRRIADEHRRTVVPVKNQIATRSGQR